MIATIINAVAIVVGGLLGLIIKGRFNKKLQAIASQATGLSVLVVGLNTALTYYTALQFCIVCNKSCSRRSYWYCNQCRR